MAITVDPYGNQSDVDYYIDLMMRQESKPKVSLEERKSDLSNRSSVLSSLDSKLSSLHTISERFNDPLTDHFASKSAESSDAEKFTVSATDAATIGNHSLSVNRLATSDTRVSQQYDSLNHDFSTLTTDETFSIDVGHYDENGDYARETIDIKVFASTFTKTNEEVLQDIAEQINEAMYTSVTAETIDNDETVSASVVSESNGKSRLVLRSQQTGYNFRMIFTDSSNNLLQKLGVNDSVKSSGTSGGYITEIGTSSTDSELNSHFVMDGLEFYRDGNNVTDVLTGVTLDFKDTFTTSETITLSSDEDSVKTEVNNFISIYNDLLSFLKTTTQINPDTYQQGVLSGDLTYRAIHSELRNIIGSTIDSVENSDYSRLYHIGVEIGDDGKLSIGEPEKLTEALSANPSYVSNLFNSTNGITSKIQDYLESYVKTGGTIDSSKKNIESNIISLNDRIGLMNEALARKETQLRSEFTHMQNMISQYQQQQSYLSSFAQMF